jgi:hypothetical protein
MKKKQPSRLQLHKLTLANLQRSAAARIRGGREGSEWICESIHYECLPSLFECESMTICNSCRETCNYNLTCDCTWYECP